MTINEMATQVGSLPSHPLESPEVVGQKAQSATKLLAESVALKYQQFMMAQKQTAPPAQATPSVPMDIKTQSEIVLKTLAENIGQKYQFVRQQKSISTVDTSIPAPTAQTDRRSSVNQSAPQSTFNQGQSMIGRGSVVSERKLQPRITTNVTENVRGSFHPSAKQINNQVAVVREEGVIHTNIVEKSFDMIVEKPVIREIVVEKPYEVIIQKPVENIIEKEIIIEKHIENPIERIIEQPVERVVEKQIEVLVERPVIIENFVDKPIENVIEKQVDVIVERDVPVTRSVNRTIE